MPQVAIGANLKFTNHWIGIYDPRARNLVPAKHAVKGLQPAPVDEPGAGNLIVPAAPSTLVPVYAAALAERERRSGPYSKQAAREAADLGAFLLQMGSNAGAEVQFRRALAIDERTADPAIDADRESLAQALAALDSRDEALELYGKASAGDSPRVAARSFVKLAEMDRDHAELYYRNAVASEEKASGKDSPRVAVLLQEYALTLRSAGHDADAEPLLPRALSIQQAVLKA